MPESVVGREIKRISGKCRILFQTVWRSLRVGDFPPRVKNIVGETLRYHFQNQMHMKALQLILLFVCCSTLLTAQPQLTELTCEGQANPLGIDVTAPRFSWQLLAKDRGAIQQSYELRVGKDRQRLSKGEGLVWESGKVTSSQSLDIAYGGAPVEAKTRYYWQVRVADQRGKISKWSDVQFFEMGPLTSADWKGQWIQSTASDDSVTGPAIRFRKPFDITKTVKSARLYITAHGLYELHFNTQRVGDGYLTPGWTSYNKRLQYQVYDVTEQVKSGANVLAAELASGWYRGYLGWANNKNVYGKKLGLLLQLDIVYSDGTSESVVTDNTWKCSSDGPIRSSEIYHGEIYDARKHSNDWLGADFGAQEWLPVELAGTPDEDVLVATEGPLVKKHEVFKPLAVITTPRGETVLDFGQNLVGWVKLNVNGSAGQTITIHHAEVLDKDGNFYTDNLRAADAKIVYTCAGGDETFEPRFTFFGFRYIKVEGFPGEPKPENFSAVALYSDMRPTGTFKCSDPLVNQLEHNIQWGQRGNFLDVPTDCPQRDERLGWTGDAQVFSNTAAYNMDVRKFFAKWLKDLAADQTKDGRIPFVIPNILDPNAGGSTGWADAGTIIPWNLYVAYGDMQYLKDQYPSMQAWIEFMRSRSEGDNLWNEGFHFGDWLFYRPFDDNDGLSAVTDKYLIAQAFFYNSVQIMKRTAALLGKTEDAKQYEELGEKVKAAFQKEYITGSGRLVSGTQTAYVLALQFDLMPEQFVKPAADRLVANIRNYGTHLTTGFLGTPYLCHVLSKYGHTGVAYELLLQPTYPSWLYPVKMGATTIWERWDGIKPDSTFQTPGMNSFNHYAYGAIGDWMYKTIAGINSGTGAGEVGYKHSILAPSPGGGMTSASGVLLTRYGRLSVSWSIDGDAVTLDVEVPANTTASLTLPTQHPESVTEGGKPLSKSGDAIVANGNKLELGSGRYQFTFIADRQKK